MFKPLEIVNRLTGSSRKRSDSTAHGDSSSSESDDGGYESPPSGIEMEDDEYLSAKMDTKGVDSPIPSSKSKQTAFIDTNNESALPHLSPTENPKTNKASLQRKKKGMCSVATRSKTPSPRKADVTNITTPEDPQVMNASTAKQAYRRSVPSDDCKSSKKPSNAADSNSKVKGKRSLKATTVGTVAVRASTASVSPAEKETADTSVNASLQPKANVTPTPAKKKRLSASENLEEEARFAYACMKEMVEETLRSKKAIHKEKLKEIKETEDKLRRLKDALLEIEESIKVDLEKRKDISKHVKSLKRACSRVIEKAAKDRDTAKANMRAKITVLRQALRDAAKQKDEVNKKKRKKWGDEKDKRRKSRNNESASDDEDSDDGKLKSEHESDDGDSDWEGASYSRKKKSRASTKMENPTTVRRQTRLRCSLWTCTACTLENDPTNNECAACDAPKPGFIPEF